MISFVARRMLNRMSAHYDYDVSYMQHMLDVSPKAFFKFSKLMNAAGHRESASVDGAFAASLVGAVAEDCGPCTQLVVNMALEAGMPGDQVEAVLTRNTFVMNDDVFLGFRFADAIVRRLPEADSARDDVRARWGDKGVIDLSMILQIGRMFPMLKSALGYAKTCQQVQIEKSAVNVMKDAA